MSRDFNADEADRRTVASQRQGEIETLRENIADQRIVVSDAAIEWATSRRLRGNDPQSDLALSHVASILEDLKIELARAES